MKAWQGPAGRRLTAPATDEASLTDEQIADAVRLVEDAIDATSERCTCGLIPTARTGRVVVASLVEAGWTPPPTTGTPLDLIQDT